MVCSGSGRRVIDPQDSSNDSVAAATQLRAILDHAFEFIGIIDVTGKLMEVNAAALNFVGVSRSEVVGRPFVATPWWRWSAAQQTKLANGIAQAARNEFVRFEAEHRAADGSIEPIDFSLTPVSDRHGNVTHLVVEGRRIGERKRIENTLRAHTQELEVAKNAAERANLSKSEFLAAASHDLRQPLQTIALVHAILLRIVKDRTAADQLQSLAEAIRTMENLLSALLDINRLESGAIAPTDQVFPLEKVLAPIRSDLGIAAADKKLKLVVPVCKASVRTDPRLFDVILRNLISNAIKYTPSGMVKLDATIDGKQVQIAVSDTGIGIPASHAERIFEDFYQVGNPARDKGRGVGLGLGIVRRLSALLSLPIRVHSEVGRGSTFYVQVPLAEAETDSAPATISDTAKQRALTARRDLNILHVEDDPAVAAALRVLLEVEGYQVTQAGAADEALRLVETEGFRPDLIITDYQLPHGCTGDQVVTNISRMLGRRPPCILLTGDIGREHRAMLEQAVDRILEKPADVEALLEAIETLSMAVTADSASRSDQGRSVEPIR